VSDPTIVGTPSIVQSTSNITAAFGAGWQAGDIHYILQRIKAVGTNDVAATPSGYTDIDSETVSAHVGMRLSGRILANGDTAPVIAPVGGAALMVDTWTVRGARNDSIANMIEAVAHMSNSSSTAVNYPALTIATDNCLVVVCGTFNNQGSGTLGTPTTLSGSAVAIAGPYVGTNMKAVIWADPQTSHANITAGNIPITGGSTQTNRGLTLAIRPAVSSVTISSAGTARFYDTQTAITITGSSFGAGHTGSAKVVVSAVNNISDASAVTQTYAGTWNSSTAIFDAVLSSFAFDTDLYLFVMDSAGASNASGFVIQRAPRFQLAGTIKSGGSNWASQTGIIYSVRAGSIRGAELLGNTNLTTNGSGAYSMPFYVLPAAGAIAAGDPVYVSLFKEDAVIGNTRATTRKVVPTYV